MYYSVTSVSNIIQLRWHEWACNSGGITLSGDSHSTREYYRERAATVLGEYYREGTAAVFGEYYRGGSRSTRRKINCPFATPPTKHSTRTVLELNPGLRGNIQSVLILVSRPVQLKIWPWQKLTRLLTDRGERGVFKRENVVVKFQCYVIRGNKTTSAAKLMKHSLWSPP
jgi:hypothetical protein